MQLDCCRWVYNKTLQVRRDAYANEGVSLSRYDTNNLLTDWKQEETWLRNGYSQCTRDAQTRVDLAFRAFFRRCKAGEKPGYPRFRSADRYDSFTYPQNKSVWKFIGTTHLHLSKIGEVKIKLHRQITGVQKTLTIRRNTLGQWYATFSCIVESNLLPETDKVVGIDLGLTHFATFSDGSTVENPRFFKRDQQTLAKAQRRLSAAKKASTDRRKRKRVVQHIHTRITNRRNNFAHQESRKIVNQYQFIAFEKLQIQQMQDGNFRSMNRSISDVAWSQFTQFCSHKAEEAGRKVIGVDCRYTSQTCPNCGTKKKKSLVERKHKCEKCGYTTHRDTAAAQVILGRMAPSFANTQEVICV